MATTSSLFLYSLTIQTPTDISAAIIGSFTGRSKSQEILVASGSFLNFYRLSKRATLDLVISHNTFGIIRSLAGFRVPGTPKDYIAVGSDSGRLTILEFDGDANTFKTLALETFGKSGVRRAIPGQYLAMDPKGRGGMIASVEKNKLVYILNRTPQIALTISSPLEAHRANTIVFSIIALDTDLDNPMFAALEVDYTEPDLVSDMSAAISAPKELVFYELDLGLNHVVRKHGITVDRTAHLLIQVPGEEDGPSGVIVCGEESIIFYHAHQSPHKVPIPRRRGLSEDPYRKRHIVIGSMHRMGADSFFLLQTDDGDIFKATLELDDDGSGRVQELRISYFETIPVATNMLITKTGTLFATHESGNHQLYLFNALDDDESTAFSSKDYSSEPQDRYDPAYFYPRPSKNLSPIVSLDSMSPMMDVKVDNITDDDVPLIYAACGTGARSNLKKIRTGLETEEHLADEFQEQPTGIWTTRLSSDDAYDGYIVISYTKHTFVLRIGETIVADNDTGLLATEPTIAVSQFGEDGIVQVYPRGVRYIQHAASTKEVSEWACPQHRTIVAAACNSRQVAIALSSGEICYFENDATGLIEYDERKEMDGTVTSLCIGDVPEGAQRSRFLAVGCDDNTVRIVDLSPNTTLETLATRGLTSAPSSLVIAPMIDSSSTGSTLTLHIGLRSGVYIRTTLDERTGDLGESTLRFLGTRPIRLSSLVVRGQSTVLAMTTKTWLSYSDPQTRKFMLKPLDDSALDSGCGMHTGELPRSIAGISGKKLRIFTIASLEKNLIQENIPLAHTPKKLVQHPEQSLLYAIESDNNTLSAATRARLQDDPRAINGDAVVLPPEEFGYPRSRGHWASCIQVVDPMAKEVSCTVHLEDGEAATSVALVNFESHHSAYYLAVGTGKNMQAVPRQHSGGFIHIYRISEDGRQLDFVHKTETDDPPLALAAFQGLLLAGVGTTLTLFDIGMHRCLRKARNVVAPNLIVGIRCHPSHTRIIVSDVRESITYVTYDAERKTLLPFADDTIARWMTCSEIVDHDSVAGGDKFGNLWLVRCPGRASEEADEEGAAAHLIHERGYMGGTSNRLSLEAHYFPGDIPISMQKCQLVGGAREVVLWAGLQGTIGVLIPFVARQEAEFFLALEGWMREVDQPLLGREHLAYRGYYAAVKGVIDGDLCERYSRLSYNQKAQFAADHEQSITDIERKINDMRIRSAF